MPTPGALPANPPVLHATPDLRRRMHARLAERIDLARPRHKPLSLLRHEARRALDPFLDHHAPHVSRADRDRLAEDVVAAAPGVGVLEELFRDDAVAEVMVLGPAVVLARKGGDWLPTNVRFRDADQWRHVLTQFAEAGEPLAAVEPTGGIDVRLANGFRVMAVLPPEVLGQPPSAVLVRVAPPTTPGATGRLSGTVTPPPRAVGHGSGVVTPPPVGDGRVSFGTPAPATASPSGRFPPPARTDDPLAAPPDPLDQLRQRVADRIALALAGAGVYDLSEIPGYELRRFVTAAVYDYCAEHKIGPGEIDRDRLALEILAKIHR